LAAIGLTDMYYSNETLEALIHSASCGSFSAAARHLGKSQSTISELISRLEIDLNTEVFVRGTRSLTPTPAGVALIRYAKEALHAADRFRLQANSMTSGKEFKLTLVLSDLYQHQQYATRLSELDARYPDLQFDCLIAERRDVLNHILQGRGQLGLLAAQPDYPAEVANCRLNHPSEFGIFVRHGHELLERGSPTHQDLIGHRMLRLSSVARWDDEDENFAISSLKFWSAPDYLTLLEMAALGFGWAILPKALVVAYGSSRLQEIVTPGWPKTVPVDAVWSRKHPLGPAASWLLDRLMID